MYTLVVCPKLHTMLQLNSTPVLTLAGKHYLIQIHRIQKLGASSSSRALLLHCWNSGSYRCGLLHSGEFTLTVFMCARFGFGQALYGCAFNTFLCINSAPAVQQRRFLGRRKQEASFLLSKEECSLMPRRDVNGTKCVRCGTCLLLQSTPM